MLKYYYGTMASGKSASLLMNAYQKKINNVDNIVLKPNEKRDKSKIKSRVGLERDCLVFKSTTDLYTFIKNLRDNMDVKYFYIDECQFLTPKQVHQLWECTRELGVQICCFGLKTNFKNELFEGVKTLMVYADSIQELEPKSVCKYCEENATTHLLIVNNEPVLEYPEKFEGDVKGNIRYECVCQKCWHDNI